MPLEPEAPATSDLRVRDGRLIPVDERVQVAAPPFRRRRTPDETDALRVQMLREGYPVSGLTPKENEHVFSSLLQRRRLARVLALAGFDQAGYQAAVQRARRQRTLASRQRRMAPLPDMTSAPAYGRPAPSERG